MASSSLELYCVLEQDTLSSAYTGTTVKPVLSSHSKIDDKTNILLTMGS